MSSKNLLIFLLAIVTLAVFWQTGSHEFINYDDPGYVYANPHVTGGLTGDNIRWAFTSFAEENWHPLTWLSHMLDCQLFGLDPRGHHLTSLLIHILNTLLLFVLLRRFTGAERQSAFVAALFALHPLHVESVAWVAERKDLLSTLFFLLALGAYRRYCASPSVPRYLSLIVLFAASLMAKPMLVTLPFVLLLLDYWPLQRISRMPLSRLLQEKIPLLLLSGISSFITLQAQQVATASTAALPLTARLANGLVAYATYLGKTFWPHPLAILYPFPDAVPFGKAAAALFLLVAISVAVSCLARRRPFLVVGWLWFLGTLVPVIGLVQVGTQAMADRYTYLPLIGLFMMIAWGIPALLAKRALPPRLATVLAAASLVACAGLTFLQLRHWQDSVAILTHTTRFTSHPYLSNNLGAALVARGRFADGVASYEEALRLKPGFAFAWKNLGLAYLKWGDALAGEGKDAQAVDRYRQALQLDPDAPLVHHRLGLVLAPK